jgi:hypothetical protein
LGFGAKNNCLRTITFARIIYYQRRGSDVTAIIIFELNTYYCLLKRKLLVGEFFLGEPDLLEQFVSLLQQH